MRREAIVFENSTNLAFPMVTGEKLFTIDFPTLPIKHASSLVTREDTLIQYHETETFHSEIPACDLVWFRACFFSLLGANRFKYGTTKGKSHFTGFVPPVLLVGLTSAVLKEDSPLKVLTQTIDVGATPLMHVCDASGFMFRGGSKCGCAGTKTQRNLVPGANTCQIGHRRA